MHIRTRHVAALVTSLIAALVLAVGRAAAADTAPSSGSAPTPTAATAPVAAAPAAIEIEEDGARWENGYGERFFQVVGTVKNRGEVAVGAVRIRVELLDESGNVVATFDGWNARAEALGDLEGDAARTELRELAPDAIAPGSSDRFRSTFLADETPPFSTHRMRVLAALPPA